MERGRHVPAAVDIPVTPDDTSDATHVGAATAPEARKPRKLWSTAIKKLSETQTNPASPKYQTMEISSAYSLGARGQFHQKPLARREARVELDGASLSLDSVGPPLNWDGIRSGGSKSGSPMNPSPFADNATDDLRHVGDVLMYTKQATATRAGLMFDADIRRRLQVLWCVHFSTLALTADELPQRPVISQLDFMADHMRITRALMDPPLSREERQVAAEAEWRKDVKFGEAMTGTQFMDSIFELTDTWTTSIHKNEYINFLDKMIGRLTTPLECRYTTVQELEEQAAALDVDTDVWEVGRKLQWVDISSIHCIKELANARYWLEETVMAPPTVGKLPPLESVLAIPGAMGKQTIWLRTWESYIAEPNLRPRPQSVTWLHEELVQLFADKVECGHRGTLPDFIYNRCDKINAKVRVYVAQILGTCIVRIHEDPLVEIFLRFIFGTWNLQTLDAFQQALYLLEHLKVGISYAPSRSDAKTVVASWMLCLTVCAKTLKGWKAASDVEAQRMANVCTGQRWLVTSDKEAVAHARRGNTQFIKPYAPKIVRTIVSSDSSSSGSSSQESSEETESSSSSEESSGDSDGDTTVKGPRAARRASPRGKAKGHTNAIVNEKKRRGKSTATSGRYKAADASARTLKARERDAAQKEEARAARHAAKRKSKFLSHLNDQKKSTVEKMRDVYKSSMPEGWKDHVTRSVSHSTTADSYALTTPTKDDGKDGGDEMEMLQDIGTPNTTNHTHTSSSLMKVGRGGSKQAQVHWRIQIAHFLHYYCDFLVTRFGIIEVPGIYKVRVQKNLVKWRSATKAAILMIKGGTAPKLLSGADDSVTPARANAEWQAKWGRKSNDGKVGTRLRHNSEQKKPALIQMGADGKQVIDANDITIAAHELPTSAQASLQAALHRQSLERGVHLKRLGPLSPVHSANVTPMASPYGTPRGHTPRARLSTRVKPVFKDMLVALPDDGRVTSATNNDDGCETLTATGTPHRWSKADLPPLGSPLRNQFSPFAMRLINRALNSPGPVRSASHSPTRTTTSADTAFQRDNAATMSEDGGAGSDRDQTPRTPTLTLLSTPKTGVQYVVAADAFDSMPLAASPNVPHAASGAIVMKEEMAGQAARAKEASLMAMLMQVASPPKPTPTASSAAGFSPWELEAADPTASNRSRSANLLFGDNVDNADGSKGKGATTGNNRASSSNINARLSTRNRGGGGGEGDGGDGEGGGGRGGRGGNFASGRGRGGRGGTRMSTRGGGGEGEGGGAIVEKKKTPEPEPEAPKRKIIPARIRKRSKFSYHFGRVRAAVMISLTRRPRIQQLLSRGVLQSDPTFVKAPPRWLGRQKPSPTTISPAANAVPHSPQTCEQTRGLSMPMFSPVATPPPLLFLGSSPGSIRPVTAGASREKSIPKGMLTHEVLDARSDALASLLCGPGSTQTPFARKNQAIQKSSLVGYSPSMSRARGARAQSPSPASRSLNGSRGRSSGGKRPTGDVGLGETFVNDGDDGDGERYIDPIAFFSGPVDLRYCDDSPPRDFYGGGGGGSCGGGSCGGGSGSRSPSPPPKSTSAMTRLSTTPDSSQCTTAHAGAYVRSPATSPWLHGMNRSAKKAFAKKDANASASRPPWRPRSAVAVRPVRRPAPLANKGLVQRPSHRQRNDDPHHYADDNDLGERSRSPSPPPPQRMPLKLFDSEGRPSHTMLSPLVPKLPSLENQRSISGERRFSLHGATYSLDASHDGDGGNVSFMTEEAGAT